VASPLNLALTLSLNDRLVGPLRRALGLVDRNVKEAERSLEGMGRTGKEAAQALGQVGQQAGGIRNTTREVRELDRATRDAERSTSRLAGTFNQVRSLARGVGSVVAGGAAFSHVVAAPLRRAADYDTALRGLANTAYAGQPLDVRRAGLRGLDASITAAVRAGGGTRDSALATLNELVSSGAFGDVNDAARLLPMLQRGGTASGADPTALAQIAIRAKQTFGITPAQMPLILGQAMAAGQAGGFELRDMAKWLPQQMAAARQLGLSGTEGFVKLLGANQASVITAGTKDEAGNNLVNLLAKINSADTANDFRRLGIDLPGSLAAARSKGVDGLSAFVNMVDKIVAGDARFQAARRNATSGSEPDRRAAAEAQADILQGSAVGKVIQDRQALMALIALMNNRGYVSTVEAKTRAGGESTTHDALALFEEGPGYKYDQRNFEVLKAQTEAMNSANSAVVKLAEVQTDLYKKYPGFADSVEFAKVALWGLAAAAGAAGAVNLLANGGKVVGAVGGLLGLGRVAASTVPVGFGGMGMAAGAAGAAAGGIGLGSAALATGGVALAGAAAYGAGTLFNDYVLSGTKAGDELGELLAKAAAFFGSQEAQNALNTTRQFEAAQAMKTAADKLSTMPPMQVHLDGVEIFSTIDQIIEQTARRR
jgi:hypothetical protein